MMFLGGETEVERQDNEAFNTISKITFTGTKCNAKKLSGTMMYFRTHY